MTAAAPSKQVPPQDIRTEESVLGAMLVAEPALMRVIDEVELSPNPPIHPDGWRIAVENGG